VHQVAEQRGGTPFIFASRVGPTKGERYPLEWDIKRDFLLRLFPKHNIMYDIAVSDPFYALEYIIEQGFTDVVMVVGSDRVEEFRTRFDKNKTTNRFNTLEVISGGERDESDDVSQMSSTRARKAAVNNDILEFKRVTGWTGNIAEELMKAVHHSLKGMTNNVKRRKSISS